MVFLLNVDMDMLQQMMNVRPIGAAVVCFLVELLSRVCRLVCL
jgi:hypothetical protein